MAPRDMPATLPSAMTPAYMPPWAPSPMIPRRTFFSDMVSPFLWGDGTRPGAAWGWAPHGRRREGMLRCSTGSGGTAGRDLLDPTPGGGPAPRATAGRGSERPVGRRGGGVLLLEDRDVLVDPLLGQRVPEQQREDRDG